MISSLALVWMILASEGAETSAAEDGDTSERSAYESPLFEALGVSQALLNPNDVAAQQEPQLELNDAVQACSI